jgi:DNA polymerase-3 subunit beta
MDEPGEAILPLDKLGSILREVPDDEIAIDADQRRCLINAAFSEFELPSEDPSGFPEVPEFDEAEAIEINAGVLQSLIRRVQFAASKADTKYAVNSILCEVANGRLTLVSTDTRRLAVTSGAITGNAKTDAKAQYLIPVKAIHLLNQVLAGDEQVKLCLRPNDVIFQTPTATVHSRLVEGRYPAFRQIIPAKTNIKIMLPVAAFMSAVKQAAIMVDFDCKKVEFKFAPNKLTITASGQNTGKSKVEMKLDYSGQPASINFDPVYLVDMLKIIDPSEVVQLDMIDGNKPALFRAGEDYLYLVMPLS